MADYVVDSDAPPTANIYLLQTVIWHNNQKKNPILLQEEEEDDDDANNINVDHVSL